MNANVFWNVTLRRWVNDFRRLEGMYCLHSQESEVHLTLENEGNTFPRNVGIDSPTYEASHPRRCESSISPL